MLPACSWVRHCVGNELVGPEIERVTDNKLIGLASAKVSDLDKVITRAGIRWEDKRLLVGYTIHQVEWGRHDIHFPIADEDVPVTTKPFDAFISMHIFMIGVEKAAVAENQVKHRIGVAVRLLGVASEDVVNGPPIVEPGWNLAVYAPEWARGQARRHRRAN